MSEREELFDKLLQMAAHDSLVRPQREQAIAASKWLRMVRDEALSTPKGEEGCRSDERSVSCADAPGRLDEDLVTAAQAVVDEYDADLNGDVDGAIARLDASLKARPYRDLRPTSPSAASRFRVEPISGGEVIAGYAVHFAATGALIEVYDSRKEAEALADALNAIYTPTSPWRSIDDMPEEIKRYGVVIRAFFPGWVAGDKRLNKAAPGQVETYWFGDGEHGDWITPGRTFTGERTPTHWMPLPLPPVQEEG